MVRNQKEMKLLYTAAIYALLLLVCLISVSQTKDTNSKISYYLNKDLPDSALIYIEGLTQENTKNYFLKYLKIAQFQVKKRRVKETEQILQKIQASHKPLSPDTITYLLLFLNGQHYVNKSKWREAIEYFKEAKRLYTKNKYCDTLDLITLNTNLAYTYSSLELYDSSNFHFKQIIPLQLNDHGMMKTYWSLGVNYNALGQVDSSLLCIERVKELINEIGEANVNLHMALNSNHASELSIVNRNEEAFNVILKNQQIIKKYQKLLPESNRNVRRSNYVMAQVLSAKGEWKKTASILKRLYDLEIQIYGVNHINTAYNSIGLARSLEEIGNFDSSLYYLKQAQKVILYSEKDNVQYSGLIHRSLGRFYFRRNLIEDALIEFRKELSTRKRAGTNSLNIAYTYFDLTSCFIKKNQYDSADKYLWLSIQANTYHDSAFSRIPSEPVAVHSNPLMLESIFCKAEIQYRKGILNSTELGNTFIKWREVFERDMNNPHDLLELTYVQDDFIGLLIKSDIDPSKTIPMILNLHENNQNKLLMHELEMKNAKNSIISDSLRIIVNSLDQSIDRARNIFLTSNKETLATAKKDLELFKKSKRQLLIKLKKTNPNYFNLRYKKIDDSIPIIQSFLRKDQALLKYILNGSDLILIYVDNSQNFLFKLDSDRLKEDIKQFISLISSPDINKSMLRDFKQTSYELYNRLIGPVQHLILKKSLIINRDQYLNRIPFEALLTENHPYQESYNSLSYLVRNNTVSYIHSLRAFDLPSSQASFPKNVKFGAFLPSYDSIYLKWSNQEITSIENNFKVDIYNEQSNIRRKFLSEGPTYDYLHFVGHGILNDEDPMKSYLMFSDNKSDRVSAAEIHKMNLSSELVALSACNTGIGKYQHGEGMMSISRAFLYAGAKTVLMTLWSINDHSSNILMNYFYEGLGKSFDKDEALRYAKINYLVNQNEVFSHPYYWAGFVLLGDTNKIKAKSHFTIQLFLLILLPLFIVFILKRKYHFRLFSISSLFSKYTGSSI